LFSFCSVSSYGADKFSNPKSLRFNSALSMKESKFSYEPIPKGVKILNQVSGTRLPNLIFNLLDETDEIIDSTYVDAISDVVTLNVATNTAASST